MTRTMYVNIATLVISLIISLGLAEIFTRMFFANQNQSYSVSTTGNQYKFYQFDPKLGWKNAPGRFGTFRRKEFEYKFSINEHAMRQEAVSKEKTDPNRYRIAFMGDSFLWGIGVSNSQRFSDIIGKNPSIEALNFGVSGYSPAHYLLQLKDIVQFKPDLVVVGFTLSNDYADNVLYKRYGYYKPYFALSGNKDLVLKGYPLENVKEFANHLDEKINIPVLDKSQFIQKIQSLYKSKIATPHQEGLVGFKNRMLYTYEAISDSEKELVKKAIEINKKIFEKIKMVLNESGIPLIVVSFPTKCEYHPECQYGQVKNNFRAVSFLENTLKELDIPFINTVPKMSGTDFWKKDGHWNPEGHKKMAEFIKQYLDKNNYVKTGAQ